MKQGRSDDAISARRRHRALPAVGGAVVLVALTWASLALAAGGTLTYRDCFSADSGVGTKNRCTQATASAVSGFNTGLDSLQSVAVSPDGASVYAVSLFDDSIVRFDRDSADGALSYRDCFSADSSVGSKNSCTQAADSAAGGSDTGLDALVDVTVSPDGASVYAVSTGDSAIVRFDRDSATGALTYRDCFSADSGVGSKNSCTQAADSAAGGIDTGFLSLGSIAVSPDGASVYATSLFDASIVRFGRDSATGELSYQGCFSADSGVGTKNSCTQAADTAANGTNTGLDGLVSVAVSPDGSSVYAASGADASIVRFKRDSATGALSYQGCFSADSGVGTKNSCTRAADTASNGIDTGLGTPASVVVSPDGASVYAAAASDASIVRLDRNSATGALTYRGCFSADRRVGTKNSCTQATDSIAFATDTGFDGLISVAVSPDGASVYAAAERDDAIVRFDRNGATGALIYDDCVSADSDVGTSNGCVQSPASVSKGADTGLDGLVSVAVSSDSSSVYAASAFDDSVVRLGHELTPPPNPPPVPPDTTAPTLELSGKKKQSSRKRILVKGSCDEACTATVKSKGKATIKAAPAEAAKKTKLKLKLARKQISAGASKRFKLRFQGKATKKLVKRTLKRKKGRIKLKLQGTATDAAANKAKDTIRLTLR